MSLFKSSVLLGACTMWAKDLGLEVLEIQPDSAALGAAWKMERRRCGCKI